MRMSISKKYAFEAAHRLPKVPEGHQCGRLHGHSYGVEIEISGEVQSDAGWVLDFAELSSLVKPLVDQLDHQCLNDFDGLENPTSENLCAWFWRLLSPDLPGLSAISISETASSRSVYRGIDQ